jgi:hypothetical protein
MATVQTLFLLCCIRTLWTYSTLQMEAQVFFETSVYIYLLLLDATSQKLVISIVTVVTTSNLAPNFVKQIKLRQIKWVRNVEHR